MKLLRNPVDNAAAEVAIDRFERLGKINIRAMFGGAGIYADGFFFAIIHGGDIFLKADPALARELSEMGSRQFTWTRPSTGKIMKMDYWFLPEAALSDSELAIRLGKKALALAQKKASLD